MCGKPVTADAAIARLAAAQHGVVALRQLRALGLSDREVHHRAAMGRLHRVHRGVYAVGHPLLSVRGGWLAAVLAAGEGATLSHRAAAALWDLQQAAPAAVDVTVPRRATSRPGIRVHRDALGPDEVTRVDGIAVTTPARTLLDVAGIVNRRRLERALDQAEVLRILDVGALELLLGRYPSKRGAGTLRRVLAEHAIGTTQTRSELEEALVALCDRARLPRPALNVPIDLPDGGMATVDALWRDHRLVVEADGRATHLTASAFEQDRHRDAQLTLAGYRVVRFTWHQLVHRRRESAAILRALLA